MPPCPSCGFDLVGERDVCPRCFRLPGSPPTPSRDDPAEPVPVLLATFQSIPRECPLCKAPIDAGAEQCRHCNFDSRKDFVVPITSPGQAAKFLILGGGGVLVALILLLLMIGVLLESCLGPKYWVDGR